MYVVHNLHMLNIPAWIIKTYKDMVESRWTYLLVCKKTLDEIPFGYFWICTLCLHILKGTMSQSEMDGQRDQLLHLKLRK